MDLKEDGSFKLNMQYFDYCAGLTMTNKKDFMKASLLGHEYNDDQILQYLNANNIPFDKLPSGEMPARIADLIAQEKTIGWFQGRMEFGPRALGARSIIGDARSSKMQEIMNLKIKFRESFRPFAPSVLREKTPRTSSTRTSSTLTAKVPIC
jgi:carbamoyltransferase